MNIHRGDNVIMLSGKDRGKRGKVLVVYLHTKRGPGSRQKRGSRSGVWVNSEDQKVRVEGLNMIKKHQRPKKQGQKGQIVNMERRVAVSSVQLVCPSCGKPTRVGHARQGDIKMRVCKKCGAEFT